MRALHFYSRFSSFILFFFISFISFFFLGIDAEYNLNQQIDRGYISRNSIFFAFDCDNTADMTLLQNGASESSGQIKLSESGNGEIESPVNEIAGNNLSFIENILSSGGTDYFAAVHTGKGRYVYYHGSVQLPPVLSGRFFTSDECLSRSPLAVIGKALESQTFIEDENTYIMLDGIKCEVIGVVGMAHDSTIDHLYFINIGAVPVQMQIGRFYIDGLQNMEKVFEKINTASMEWMHAPVRKLDVPMTFTDAVSGNVYLKQQIKVVVLLLLGFIYLSILYQAITAERRKIGIMKIIGLTPMHVIRKVQLPLFISGATGILFTVAAGALFVGLEYFALPNSEVTGLLIKCCAASALMLVVWFMVFLVHDKYENLREVTQQL